MHVPLHPGLWKKISSRVLLWAVQTWLVARQVSRLLPPYAPLCHSTWQLHPVHLADVSVAAKNPRRGPSYSVSQRVAENKKGKDQEPGLKEHPNHRANELHYCITFESQSNSWSVDPKSQLETTREEISLVMRQSSFVLHPMRVYTPMLGFLDIFRIENKPWQLQLGLTIPTQVSEVRGWATAHCLIWSPPEQSSIIIHWGADDTSWEFLRSILRGFAMEVHWQGRVGSLPACSGKSDWLFFKPFYESQPSQKAPAELCLANKVRGSTGEGVLNFEMPQK